MQMSQWISADTSGLRKSANTRQVHRSRCYQCAQRDLGASEYPPVELYHRPVTKIALLPLREHMLRGGRIRGAGGVCFEKVCPEHVAARFRGISREISPAHFGRIGGPREQASQVGFDRIDPISPRATGRVDDSASGEDTRRETEVSSNHG
jgi:hypothetical protein